MYIIYIQVNKSFLLYYYKYLIMNTSIKTKTDMKSIPLVKEESGYAIKMVHLKTAISSLLLQYPDTEWYKTTI